MRLAENEARGMQDLIDLLPQTLPHIIAFWYIPLLPTNHQEVEVDSARSSAYSSPVSWHRYEVSDNRCLDCV